MYRTLNLMSANEPGQIMDGKNLLSRLAGWIRTRRKPGLHSQMHWYLSKLLGQRIWVILPGQKAETGQTLILPFSLARMLRQRSQETDQPVDSLLPALLRTALVEQRPPDPAELAWRSLTEREREVACLMAEGLSNRQIAARLTISLNTVRTHARRIVRKFGCSNRRGLPDLRPYCSVEE